MTRRTRRWAAALLMVLMTYSTNAQASGFQIIVNEANPVSSMRSETVRKLMLGKLTRWSHGETARPIDQTQDAQVREEFSRAILRKSVSAVKAYWQTRIFSGRGVPPAELRSSRSVVDFVRQNSGAIGYVASGTPTTGVKIIEVTD